MIIYYKNGVDNNNNSDNDNKNFQNSNNNDSDEDITTIIIMMMLMIVMMMMMMIMMPIANIKLRRRRKRICSANIGHFSTELLYCMQNYGLINIPSFFAFNSAKRLIHRFPSFPIITEIKGEIKDISTIRNNETNVAVIATEIPKAYCTKTQHRKNNGYIILKYEDGVNAIM